MAESVLEMAHELVFAHIQAGGVTLENMSEMLTQTHHQLMLLQAQGASGSESGVAQTASRITDWRKSK